MRHPFPTLFLVWLVSTPADAQPPSRWYAGGAFGATLVTADPVDTSPIPATRGIIGVRLRRNLSVELDIERALGTLSRVYEGIGISWAPPDADRETIERLGVTQHFEEHWRPRVGTSAIVAWHSTSPGRPGAVVFGGLSYMSYDRRRTVTTIDVPAGVDPDHPSLGPRVESSRVHRGGLTAGLFVLVEFGRRLSAAPEIRYTYGSIGDERHTVLSLGGRVLWRF